MPKAYDYDLRRKVLEAIELNGMKRSEASEMFGISRNTIHQWQKLQQETGDIKPRASNHRGHSHKITDWEKFQAFVRAHPNKTQVQLAQLWDDEISDRTISRALKRIGFTRKKNIWIPRARRAKTRRFPGSVSNGSIGANSLC